MIQCCCSSVHVVVGFVLFNTSSRSTVANRRFQSVKCQFKIAIYSLAQWNVVRHRVMNIAVIVILHTCYVDQAEISDHWNMGLHYLEK